MDRHNLGPLEIEMSVIEQAIESDDLAILPSSSVPLRAPGDLSTKAKAMYDFWRPHFESLLKGRARENLLEASYRVRAIERIAAETKKPELTVRRWMYSVLRAGCSLLGLCPRLHDRGGRGKFQRKGTAKRGRKALPGSIESAVPLPEVRAILEAAVRGHVIKDKEPVDKAYRKMIAESFVRTSTQTNGAVRILPFDESERPTLAQFRRVSKQVLGGNCSRAKGPARRATPGRAKDGVPGPAYRYEIDATGGRLELVSEFDLSQPIGVANAYAVIDVATTVCVGGAMGVFHAGWRGAQISLFNTFTSKRDLCARWDIDIPEEAWPCSHLPRLLTSDRGELVGDAAEAMPEELGIAVETAPPYRPEAKGTVEGWFSHLKAGDIRSVVGFGRKEKRGERNPRDQAALTRYDAMRLWILSAMKHNHQPAPQGAIPPEMLEAGFQTISRITLWHWLMNNRVTGARIADPRLIYTSLLRKCDAKIRHDGLYVEGVRYISPELRENGLLQRAAQFGPTEVEATVDDFAARTVWYRVDMDAVWVPAYLADQQLKDFDATFEELREHYRRCRTVQGRTHIESAVYDRSVEPEFGRISSDAIARQKSGVTGRKKTANVRASRAVDAADELREHGSKVLASHLTQQNAGEKRKAHAAGPRDAADGRKLSRLNLARAAFLKPGEGSK